MMYPQFWYGYHFYIFYLMKIYSWCFVVFSFVTFFSIVLLPFIINIDIISILVIFKHTREFSWLHIHVIYKNLLLILVSIHFVSSNQCKNVLQILLWYLLCQHFYFWDFYFWIPTTKTNYSLTWLVFNFFFVYCAAGTLYMVQKLLYYTISIGGRNTVEKGRKTAENRRKWSFSCCRSITAW